MTDATLAFAQILDGPAAALVYDEPDEPWFIEPRDKSPASEIQRQAAFLKSLRQIAPGCIAFAVPNAAKRTRWAAQRARKEGMVAGALDLVILWPGGSAYPEFKNGKEVPTPEQRRMLNRLYRAGHHTGVFRNAVTLLEHLREWGAPVPAVRG